MCQRNVNNKYKYIYVLILRVSCKESPSSDGALPPGWFCSRELQPREPEQVPEDASKPFPKSQILYRHLLPKGKGIALRMTSVKARPVAGPCFTGNENMLGNVSSSLSRAIT